MEERLQKILARAGVASRRRAEQLLSEGCVTVNGRVVRTPGAKADAARDSIKVNGKLVSRPEHKVYLLFHKPRNVVTTLDDPQGRPCVRDFLKRVKERVYPVGRLDFASEGALLLTNDGELAQALMHPRYGVEKVYHVKVQGKPGEKTLARLRRGIRLDGVRLRPCRIRRLRQGEHTWFEIALREGRNRQLWRMFSAAGHPVLKLRRVAVGPVMIAHLAPGGHRPLQRREVEALRRACKSGNCKPGKAVLP
jgi:pseudouridine synthase